MYRSFISFVFEEGGRGRGGGLEVGSHFFGAFSMFLSLLFKTNRSNGNK